MNVSWTIALLPLENFVSTSEYTIFPNNSLLMQRGVTGSYRCGDSIPNVHRFDVGLASE